MQTIGNMATSCWPVLLQRPFTDYQCYGRGSTGRQSERDSNMNVSQACLAYSPGSYDLSTDMQIDHWVAELRNWMKIGTSQCLSVCAAH